MSNRTFKCDVCGWTARCWGKCPQRRVELQQMYPKPQNKKPAVNQRTGKVRRHDKS